MDQTTELLRKIANSISERPSNWTRIQGWLTAEFKRERISVSIFGKFPYILELGATVQCKGTLDKLSIRQSLILLKAKKTWLKYCYTKIQETLEEMVEKDWHRDDAIPTEAWIKKREQEILQRTAALAEQEMQRFKAKTSVISRFKGLMPRRHK